MGVATRPRSLALSLIAAGLLVSAAAASEWPEFRGPTRDGLSTESNLPDRWSPAGENLLWRVPYGGTSGPVVLGDRVYVYRTVGEGAAEQERIVAIDANTGSLAWEKRINVNHSDAPPNRAGSSTPALDPDTGYIYVLSSGGTLSAYTRAGLPLWTRDLTEGFGFVAPDNGHLASPIVEGPLVIVDGVSFNWGEQAVGSHRYFAFDKRTGDNLWVSSPEKAPHEWSSSPGLISEVDGVRALVEGGADGAFHAIKVATGESLWRYEISRQGLNTGAIRAGQDLILIRGESGVANGAMGFMAALGAAARGDVNDRQTKWRQSGFLAAASSPVADGRRIYQAVRPDLVAAFDSASGKQLWSVKVGAIEGASPLLADGKIYAGTQEGKFFILRPRADGCDILSQVQLGSLANPEPITAGAAVSDGRVYLATSKYLYAIGRPDTRASVWAPKITSPATDSQNRMPAQLQIVPADLALYSGQIARFRVRLLDSNGNFIREEPQPQQARGAGPRGAAAQNNQATRTDLQWSLDGLPGLLESDGAYAAPTDAKGYAGKIKVKVGGLNAEARVRVIPAQWETSFDDLAASSAPAWWVNAPFAVRSLNGNKVLAKLAAPGSIVRNVRTYIGMHTANNYTMQADVRFANASSEAGVIAQGYELVLSSNRQQLSLQSWRPEGAKTASMPLKADAWYRVKLRVETQVDGGVQIHGKVWSAGDSEPQAWTIERTDPPATAHLVGSPGLYTTAASQVYFDNLKIRR